MLEIVQAGQAGKTHFLFDMHRMRKRVFYDRMAWDVTITPLGLEVDQFDLPEAVYVLALDNNRRVIGNWRLLPTTGPTMIRDLWPQFLNSIDLPCDPYVWEGSRFAVSSLEQNTRQGLIQANRATRELLCGVTELCMMCGITTVFGMYDKRIRRIFKALDCRASEISERLQIGSIEAEVGRFEINEEMITRLREASGIETTLVTSSMLPPVLRPYYKRHKESIQRISLHTEEARIHA